MSFVASGSHVRNCIPWPVGRRVGRIIGATASMMILKRCSVSICYRRSAQIYGYRRVWALLRRQLKTDDMPEINAKRVYRIMRQNALLLDSKSAIPPSKRAHIGKVAVGSSQRWSFESFEFNCDNVEKQRFT